jgi:predicted alpha/beta hydrolase
VAAARARAKKLPVVIVGHSLGGHVALASQGTGRIAADAIVGVASNVWLRDFEPSRARWLAKRATMALVRKACERQGYFPARALRMGSDDESAAYFASLIRVTERGAWASDAGVDYLASLANVRIPVLSLASDGDRINCVPICAENFHARVAGPRTIERIRHADDGGRAPGHMDIVTTDRAKSAWERVEAWMREVTR